MFRKLWKWYSISNKVKILDLMLNTVHFNLLADHATLLLHYKADHYVEAILYKRELVIVVQRVQ